VKDNEHTTRHEPSCQELVKMIIAPTTKHLTFGTTNYLMLFWIFTSIDRIRNKPKKSLDKYNHRSKSRKI